MAAKENPVAAATHPGRETSGASAALGARELTTSILVVDHEASVLKTMTELLALLGSRCPAQVQARRRCAFSVRLPGLRYCHQ
jgi:hypothetical protein